MYRINHLPLIHLERSTTRCCPPFDAKEWDHETFVFDNKPFVKIQTRNIFHVPLNMKSQMNRAIEAIKKSNAETDEFVMLSSTESPWRTSHYLAVSGTVKGMEMTKFSGAYMSKVFEGPYKDAKKWVDQLIRYVKAKGETPLRTYFYYTTCPRCAKEYGKNYVVGIEQIRYNGGYHVVRG